MTYICYPKGRIRPDTNKKQDIMYKITCTALVLCAALLFSWGCKGHNTAAEKQTAAVMDSTRTFEYIKVPDSLTSPQARAEYVTEHFWDNYDFADTTLLKLPQVSEQGFADYISILNSVEPDMGRKSIGLFLEKASAVPAARDYFLSLAEKYLYDPNSPARNEELYICAVESYLADKRVPEMSRLRPEAQLETLLKNREGTPAADFKYEAIGGAKGSLYGIKTPYTLVYFNNPECENCHITTSRMKNSPTLNEMIRDKQLTILSIYPDGQVEMWREHAADFPSNWVVAYDKGRTIDAGRLYDLRAIPSLYLLDKDKKVLMKDADLWHAEAYLSKAQ